MWDIREAIESRPLRTRKAEEDAFDLNDDKFDAFMGFLDKKWVSQFACGFLFNL